MTKASQRASLLFRVICLGFSAVLLVLTLLAQVRLVRLQGSIAALEDAIAEAEDTGTVLRIRMIARLNLDELERIAVQELGMQHPEPGQIIVLETAG